MLFALMIWYGHPPPAAIIALPLFVVLALITALGIGLWTSAMNVRYRDVQYLMPFAMQFVLLASPIAYSSSIVPAGTVRILYAMNPLVGIIQGFRWSLLGTPPPGNELFVSAGAAIVLLVSGLFFFRRMEATFADVV
jgi:lipopolysaccharide transport system permease protein